MKFFSGVCIFLNCCFFNDYKSIQIFTSFIPLPSDTIFLTHAFAQFFPLPVVFFCIPPMYVCICEKSFLFAIFIFLRISSNIEFYIPKNFTLYFLILWLKKGINFKMVKSGSILIYNLGKYPNSLFWMGHLLIRDTLSLATTILMVNKYVAKTLTRRNSKIRYSCLFLVR